MKLFNCKVRVMAEVKDEVSKTNVTHAEILILKAIHGADAVLEVVPSDQPEVDRDEPTERDRLIVIYGEPVVLKVFGAPVARISDDAPATIIPLEPVQRAVPVSVPQPARAAPKAAAPAELEDVV